LQGLQGLQGIAGAPGSPGGQGAPGSNGQTVLQQAMATAIPNAMSATYAINCSGSLVTGMGVTAPISILQNPQSVNLASIKNIIISQSLSNYGCGIGSQVTVTQPGTSVNLSGTVISDDIWSGLSSIGVSTSIATLSPAPAAPIAGEMLFVPSATYGSNHSPQDLPVGIGYLNHLAPDLEEEIYQSAIGPDNAALLRLPVVDLNGKFTSIADRKPGVFCRLILNCSSDSVFLAWSKPILVPVAPPTNIQSVTSDANSKTVISWSPTILPASLDHYEVWVFEPDLNQILNSNFAVIESNIAAVQRSLTSLQTNLAAAQVTLANAKNQNERTDAKNNLAAIAANLASQQNFLNQLLKSREAMFGKISRWQLLASVNPNVHSVTFSQIPKYSYWTRTQVSVRSVYTTQQFSGSSVNSIGGIITYP
jgi:hypothetical protein